MNKNPVFTVCIELAFGLIFLGLGAAIGTCIFVGILRLARVLP